MDDEIAKLRNEYFIALGKLKAARMQHDSAAIKYTTALIQRDLKQRNKTETPQEEVKPETTKPGEYQCH